MTLDSFIEKYNHPEAIVLLLGKRDVLKGDKDKLVLLAKKLTELTKYITFRSGNAYGSDELFKLGVSSIDVNRIELVTPYKGHRKKSSSGYNTISLDAVDIVKEKDIIYHSKQNNKYKGIVERYEQGFKDKIGMKGAYILRDTLMVVGANGLNVPKASFAIFYDDLSKPMSGGTGHTMTVCNSLEIPFIDQSVWFNWL